MDLESLPNEITTQIFNTLPTLDSVLALASTSKHFHRLYHGSQRLPILATVVEAEFGPVDDIVRICTHNASQPAYHHLTVPISDALIQQMVKIGRVARKWEEIYPFKKWKTAYADRRMLTPEERWTMRRALYRLWLYDKAFHTLSNTRTQRRIPQVVTERAALLHNFSTIELAEMFDVYLVLRDAVANNVCPSNGRIRQKLQRRFPDPTRQYPFSIHLNYTPPAPSWCATGSDGWINNTILQTAKYGCHLQPSRFHDPGSEGWGDEVNHYYVVEDMMKLDPAQILFLKESRMLKSHTEMWIKMQVDLGDMWFANNGETFVETLWHVVEQRGDQADVLKAAVEVMDLGVVVET